MTTRHLTRQPGLARDLLRANWTLAATIADRAWTVIHVGAIYILPLAIGLDTVLARMTTDTRRTGAWCILASAAILAITIVLAARPPRRPRHRSPSVQRINRRAALILVPSALTLATILGIAATKPAGLWLLAYVGTFGLIGLVAFEAAHVIVLGFQRITARSSR